MGMKPLIAPAYDGDVGHAWRDNGDGTSTIVSVQNCAPIIEQNKIAQTHGDGWMSKSKEMRSAAFIPNIIRQKWLDEEGWDAYRPDLYADKLRAKLNDPEWRFLRTAEFRV